MTPVYIYLLTANTAKYWWERSVHGQINQTIMELSRLKQIDAIIYALPDKWAHSLSPYYVKIDLSWESFKTNRK